MRRFLIASPHAALAAACAAAGAAADDEADLEPTAPNLYGVCVFVHLCAFLHVFVPGVCVARMYYCVGVCFEDLCVCVYMCMCGLGMYVSL